MNTVAEHRGSKMALLLASTRLSPQQKIDEIRGGVPVERIAALAEALGLSKTTLVEYIGVPRSTFVRRLRGGETLANDEAERVLGVESLVRQVHAMVEESGSEQAAGFDAGRWLGKWLSGPLPALGGRTPASYLDLIEGQRLVAGILAKIEHGAYA